MEFMAEGQSSSLDIWSLEAKGVTVEQTQSTSTSFGFHQHMLMRHIIDENLRGSYLNDKVNGCSSLVFHIPTTPINEWMTIDL